MLLTRLTLGIFLSVLCDNLLLTVVVPILPEFFREKASASANGKIVLWTNTSFIPVNSSAHMLRISSPQQPQVDINKGPELDYLDRIKLATKSCLKELFHLQLLDEDEKLGLLFSTKAIVQLLCNPIVGRITVRFGYKLPLCIGNFILFLCCLAFGFADSYILLLISRSCHGLASALVTISGISLVAEIYPADAERTLAMGRVMGAAALGVLIGYPFGGFLYALLGKLFPFLIIAMLTFINTVLYGSQLHFLHRDSWDGRYQFWQCLIDNESNQTRVILPVSSSWSLLKDRSILIICIAIWFSTTAMAVLEPTLPLWLIETIDPPKWQLGLVFVPDSLGYFIGTNFFGKFCLQIGRWKSSIFAIITLSIACLILPFFRAVWQLSIPHFALGLGLGVVDASLMPLLACFSDDRHRASYGTVYALAQTSVALAYSLGPLLGGQLVRLIGFPDLIRCVGFLNLIFSPFILLLAQHENSIKERVHLSIKLKRDLDNEDLTSSTTSSTEDISCYERLSKTKKVRFHFQSENERFSLKTMRGKGYKIQSGRYEPFHDDLQSD